MPWPTPQDYNEAVQNPALSFRDPELKGGTLELSPLGLPRPVTGNFASVYRVSCGQRDWAVRCFWREYADMQSRYAAISSQLRRSGLPYTVGFEYLPVGIKVRDDWLPILKMEWVQGQLLNEYVEQQLHDGTALAALAGRWCEMVVRLESAGIAHGDLQHGNVLIVNDELKLVDYDGMRVPALAGALSHEVGHQNYQHPRRSSQSFGPCLDRFSAWVVYLSLLALAEQPQLWIELQGGDECLLLRKEDFEHPSTSHAFALLNRCASPRTRGLVQRFQAALDGDPVFLPSLHEILPRSAAIPLPDWVRSFVDEEPAPTPEGFSRNAKTARVGPAAAVGLCLALWCAHLVGSVLSLGFLGAATATMAAVGITLPMLAYRQEPIVLQKRYLAMRRREQVRKLASIERARRRSAGTLARLTDRHDKDIERLGQRRAQLQHVEHRKQNAVLAVYAEITRQLGQAETAVAEREKRALARELRTLRERHITMKLRMPIRSARIDGVNWSLKLRLWLAGFRTAGDVSCERTEALQRFGHARLAPLLVWSAAVRRQARRSAPTSIPAPLHERVTLPFRTYQTWLEGARRSAEQRKREIGEAAAAYYRTRYAEMEAAIQALGERRLRQHREVELHLADACRDEPFHHRQLAQVDRDLEPLRSSTFVRYLLFLFAGIQP